MWLDNVFSAQILDDGEPLPQRKKLNIVGGIITDDDANDRTEIVLPGSSIALADTPPRAVAAAASPGVALTASRSDHEHAHGTHPGGGLHALATPAAAGFMSAADKQALDDLPSDYAPMVHTHSHSALNDLGADDHPQYVLRTDGAVLATANSWAIRDSAGMLAGHGFLGGLHQAFGTGTFQTGGHGLVYAGYDAGQNSGASVLSLKGRAGVEIQVNDATVPTTVRTPLEIIREADGAGTPDVIFVKGWFGVQTPGVTGASFAWDGTNGLRVQTANVNADGKRYLQHTDDGTRLINTALSTDPKTWTVAEGATLTIDCSMSNVHVVTITGATGDVTIALTNTRAGAEYIIMLGTDGTDFATNVLLDSASFASTYGPLPEAAVGATNKVHVRCMATVNAGKAYVLSADGFV